MLTRLMPLFAMVLSASFALQAQGFYDDDIYYDASKAKKEKQAKAVEAARKAARSNYIPSQPVADYPGSDTYVVNSGSTRDVDEYNRRYTLQNGREVTDSVSLDQLTQGGFVNTRRIERFSNPDIVSGSGDAELMDYYYAEQSQPQTTIIVNTVDPWYYGGVYSPWYNGYYSYNPWRWGCNPWYPGYYDPWYGPSWSWGCGPSWSWSWGWGGGWHHHGWHHPGWGHPGHGPIWSGNSWRPSSPGASRPHSPGGVTPSTPGRRPGNSYYGGGSSRPAYTLPSGSNSTIPGSRVNQGAGRRPSTVNSGSSTSGSGYRNSGTVPGSRANQGRSSSGNSYNNNSNTNTNRSSWNSGSRNSGSRSSWGSGSRNGGGGGGGRSSGGGRSGRH